MTAVSLVIAGGAAVPPVSLDGFLEIFEVRPGHGLLETAARQANRPYRFFPVQSGLTRALNLAISMASGEWVLFWFGDGLSVEAQNLPGFAAALAGEERCVVMFRPRRGGLSGVTAVRRLAFLYGALDDRFPCPRLSLTHWIYRIFPGGKRRYAPCEGVSDQYVDWMRAVAPAIDRPTAALVELWPDLTPPERVYLIEQAMRDRGGVIADFYLRLKDQKQASERFCRDPYREGGYNPRAFWEENTSDYVKWEIFQPDETDIVEMSDYCRPKRVLELGCGAGRNIRYFPGCEQYVGLDLSMNLLNRAVDRLETPSQNLVLGDVVHLGFKPDSFDLVFADSTIQHVQPEFIEKCFAGIAAVSSKYIGLIEFTDEIEDYGKWFSQTHMFRHDYVKLLSPWCDLVYSRPVKFPVQPALKQVFLFRKR